MTTCLAGGLKKGLTCAAIGEFQSVGEVRCAVCLGLTPPAPVVSHQLGIHVDTSHIVDDAPYLQALCVLEQVTQQRGFACR